MNTAPICPQCNEQMKTRKTKSGMSYYACPNFPRDCDETASTSDNDYTDDDAE